jgi:hypothetical protein
VVLVAILVAGIFICFSSRRKALIAFLAAAILIPPDQVLLLGSTHFPMLRILGIFGLIRVLRGKFSKKEPIFSGGMNRIDKAVIVLSLAILTDGILLWQVWAQIIFQLGNLLSAFGAYFLLRFLIRDFDDIKDAIRVLAVVAAVVAFLMAYEQATGKNLLYSTLGGARADALGSTLVREDHLRSAGPFGHPILAGTFGGILLPLFLSLWWQKKEDRRYAALGVAAATVISFSASSSTALFGFLGGIVGLCFWPLRRHLRIVRWGIVGTLIALHLYMRSPVWHLISDIDLTGGSSSYHRYQLINQCILHFWDWMLVGTKNYASWGWDMWDLSNQYVFFADEYGLIPLASFVAIIIFGFGYVGKTRRFVGDRKLQMLIWGLGASLFANVVAFFGISYFDQTIVAWYALLAMIGAAAVSVRRIQRDNSEQGPGDETLALSLDNNSDRVEIAHVATGESMVGGMSGFGERRGVLL